MRLYILSALLLAKTFLSSEESNFSVSVTLLEYSSLSMQDINIENIDPSLSRATDCYVSLNSGVLFASSNAQSGYIVQVNAVNSSDVIPGVGWRMTNLENLNTLDFCLLANHDDFGNLTPITRTGIIAGLPGEGTTLVENSLAINTLTKDAEQKTVDIHALILPGQISRAYYGTYQVTLKMTLIVNE